MKTAEQISPTEAKYRLMHFADISESEYMILYYDLAITYCKLVGKPGLILSETFMKWWQMQWVNMDITLANLHQNDSRFYSKSAEGMKRIFVGFHRLTPDDVYPHRPIYEKMKNEVLFELNTVKL